MDYYPNDFMQNLRFVNVGISNMRQNEFEGISIINQVEVPVFRALGAWYAESEFIYNLSLNNPLISDLDFVGFLHHDYDMRPLTLSQLDTALETCEVVSFESYLFEEDYRQNIMMDLRFPNQLQGKGKNCYDQILEDYNDYYGTQFSLEDLLGREINLCSAFLMKTDLFKNMMVFIAFIIESGKLDKFDRSHKYRIQGGFLERYYAVWICLKRLSMKTLSLPHRAQARKLRHPSLWQRIFYKICNA